MLDLKYVIENLDSIRDNCQNRHVAVELDELVRLYANWRQLNNEYSLLRARSNELATAKQPSAEARQVAQRAREVRLEASNVHLSVLEIARTIPNLTHPRTPIGGDECSKELYSWGVKPQFGFQPLTHQELGKRLDIMDFESGTAVAGPKFYFLRNAAVLLEMGLVRYVLDKLVKYGYTPMTTPDVSTPEVIAGLGFNPKGSSSQIYSIENHNLCLIGTAEIPIGGMMRNRILDINDLPLRIAGVSHCFRTEAGAAGRNEAGLYRVHQFTKVEMFVFAPPDLSDVIHQDILSIEEDIFQGLGVPYRVLDIASGDLGAPAYRKFDIEAWMPGRNQYGEVTSASNCTDYQSRRLNIRYRPAPHAAPVFVHTLNGTGIAIPRALVALLENGQQSDGSVVIPPALVPYVGFERIYNKGSRC